MRTSQRKPRRPAAAKAAAALAVAVAGCQQAVRASSWSWCLPGHRDTQASMASVAGRLGGSDSASSRAVRSGALLEHGQRPRSFGALAGVSMKPPSRQLREVSRRGLIEPFLVGAISWLLFTKPKNAPGAATDQLEKEMGKVKKAVQDATTFSEVADPERKKLRLAMQRLSELEFELDGAALDQENFPLPEYLHQDYGKGKIMLAVTGASGVGKSSWVNAVRRLRDRDAEAADTGVTETTMEPKMYSFLKDAGMFTKTFYRVPELDHKLLTPTGSETENAQVIDAFDGQPAAATAAGERVLLKGIQDLPDGATAEVIARTQADEWEVRLENGKLLRVQRDQVAGVQAECVVWDLPGIGTPSFPQGSYLKRMGIRYFDVVVLMTSSRFTEAELLLVEELQRFKVPFFLVRNKVDVDVQSEIEKEEDDDSELSTETQAEVAQQTVNCIQAYFSAEYNLEKVYCISTKRKLRDQYDFAHLEEDIQSAVMQGRGAAES
mmetsp:Transcript_12022/g.21713  ORF Transcript_12022/g.21713 Transcript_12022/m.21713 type:complete len:494 (+) Transcript_12022:85-1566(+)